MTQANPYVAPETPLGAESKRKPPPGEREALFGTGDMAMLFAAFSYLPCRAAFAFENRFPFLCIGCYTHGLAMNLVGITFANRERRRGRGLTKVYLGLFFNVVMGITMGILCVGYFFGFSTR